MSEVGPELDSWRRLWLWYLGKPLRFPPELSPLQKTGYLLALTLSLPSLAYLVDALCTCVLSVHPINCLYIALAFLPLVVFADRYLRQNVLVHRRRLDDRSEVYALLREAETVEKRNEKDPELPTEYPTKHENMMDEVGRLRTMGSESWTEYKILTLNQMLVDFLKIEDLKQRARSSLADLEEYAVDSAYSYDLRRYDRWEQKIDDAEEKIDKKEVELKKSEL